MRNRVLALALAVLMAISAMALLESQEQANRAYGPTLPPGFTLRGIGVLEGGTATVILGQDFETRSELQCRSVQLTCKNTGSLLWASDVRGGQFTVNTDSKGNQAQEFWWEVTASRKH